MYPIFIYTLRRLLKIRYTIFYMLLIIFFILIVAMQAKGMMGNAGMANLDMQKQVAATVFMLVSFVWIIGIPFIIMLTSHGSGLIANEESEGTLLLLVTKPIRRYEIVAGKFMALFACSFLYMAASIFFALFMMNGLTGMDPDTLDMVFKILPALLIYGCLVIIIFSSVSIALSTVFKKRIPAVIMLVLSVMFIYIMSPMILKGVMQSIGILDMNFQLSNILYYLFLKGSGMHIAPSIQIYTGFVTNLFNADPSTFDLDLQAMPPSFPIASFISPWGSILLVVIISAALFIFSILNTYRKDIT